MRGPDVDKEHSERKLSLAEFLVVYNEGLPSEFPRATRQLLEVFSNKYPDYFRFGDVWSLDQHRKRVMDWLPAYLRAQS